MAKKPETMTTTSGNPVADNQNSITAKSQNSFQTI
jgi:catalase